MIDLEAFNETPYAQSIIQFELGLADWPESDAKRHHFIPQFMLNRFGGSNERIVQLEKSTGKPQPIPVAEAASRRHLYRFENDEGTKSSLIEGIFGLAENDAAPALERLERDGEISDHDRASVALFLAYLWARTPGARKRAEALGENLRLSTAATQLNDRQDFERRMTELRKTPKELEELRQEMIQELKSGEIRSIDPDGGPTMKILLSTAHELALEMFAVTEWTLLRARGAKFVTSDRGTVSFDPTPQHPWSGAAVLSSPNAQTFFPIGAEHCLQVSPGEAALRSGEASPRQVAEINLRMYGWADRYIYGGTQEAVTAVRRALKTSKRKFAVPPTPARYTTLIERDPYDDRLARAHLARDWPAYLTAVDGSGRLREHDYMVIGEDGNAVEIGLTSEELVEERARRAGGYSPGEEMPGGVNVEAVPTRSVLPTL